MAISSFNYFTTGQAQQTYSPNTVSITSNDSYATVTSLNYLGTLSKQGFALTANDVVQMYYGANSNSYGIFTPSISSAGVTLVPFLASEPPAGGLITVTTVSSATPGNVRAFTGSLVQTATTMTSGNIVGVRGSVNMVGSSTSAYVYGCQGKVIATGTLASGQFQAGVFGQADFSAATLNACQFAPIWGDYGTSIHTVTNSASCYGLAMTNTTSAVLGGQIYLYGGATNLLLLDTNAGAVGATYVSSGGSGSPGGTIKKLAISIDGTTYYIVASTTVS